LLELAEHDRGADPALALYERQPAKERIEERRLAAPRRADDRKPLAPEELEVDRADAERPTLGDRLAEPHDDVPAPNRRREAELQLPGLVRLLDRGEVAELLLVRLLHVLCLLLLTALPVAALLPLLHAPRLRLDA